jgi:PAS domain S-box-containing protein
MLPLVFSIPALGYLAVQAQRAGWYPPPGAAVVEGVMGMVVAVGITFVVARSLERTDARRRRVEEETREWKRFFDRATFGAVFGTSDGRLGCINEAFARMHGYRVAELEGRPVRDVFLPEWHAELLERMRTVDEQGGARWEAEHVRKDGSVFPVVIDISPVRDEDGKLLYRAAYVQDITREKEGEAARARLASLVQSSDDAITAKALDGTVLAWNQGAERIFGYTAQEMIGRSIDVIIPEDRRAEHDALRKRALAGEIVVGFETERVRKGGDHIPVALTLSTIRDGRGRILGFSAIERDISALKQLERERQEWAAVIAHDLRQPTGTIRLVSELLARSEVEPAKQRAIERIRRASDRLEHMIADLLDVARMEVQRLAVNPEPVDLRGLIAEVVDATPDVASHCRTTVAPDAACAMVDVDRFVQVLSNLLSNAHKYGAPGTPIDVCVESAGDMVRVTVTNEGPGIAPDEIPKLFSRFARTRSAQSGKTPGLGLGLYICRGLVEAHGGALWVDSLPGRQTRFQFTVPRGDGEDRTPAPSSPAALAP